jgi:glycerate kinase
MDSFKSSLKAVQACEIVKKALQSINPELEIIAIPMADGGEGTAEAMMSACNGKWLEVQTMGPLPNMQVNAGFAYFPETNVALVEMAKASGLELLSPEQTNPLKTTTFGTGQLIRAAADYGAKKILLAVGGSATVDGGVGAAQALGWKFLDSGGSYIGLGGGQLEYIEKIVKPDNLNLPEIEVLCDVDNPLCGNLGAARVFGPQKGATIEMVEQLESGLNHFADVIKEKLGEEIRQIPRTGAAGGLSAGALVFMNAKLVSGIESVMRESGLTEQIKNADWVITGEGRFDSQSLQGKVISGITKAAVRNKVKIGVIAGRVELSQQEYKTFRITCALGITDKSVGLDYAISNAEILLAKASRKFAISNLQ